MSWQDRFLHAEALAYLSYATLAIRFLSFRKIGRIAAVPLRGEPPGSEQLLPFIRRVRGAIMCCAKQLPWECVCFPQGLAAQLMLRRRGIRSTLYYGAANDKIKGLNAHVWVRVGDIDVIGTENASDFAILARFPAA
jgi:hypothetical protein